MSSIINSFTTAVASILLSIVLLPVTALADEVGAVQDDKLDTEAELIAAVEAGGDVELEGDIALTKPLHISKELNLDLGSFKIYPSTSQDAEWSGGVAP